MAPEVRSNRAPDPAPSCQVRPESRSSKIGFAVKWARILQENKAIVERLGADANTVGKWRRRFAENRLDGLYDEPRSGAPRKIGDEQIADIIGRTLEETPPDGTQSYGQKLVTG